MNENYALALPVFEAYLHTYPLLRDLLSATPVGQSPHCWPDNNALAIKLECILSEHPPASRHSQTQLPQTTSKKHTYTPTQTHTQIRLSIALVFKAHHQLPIYGWKPESMNYFNFQTPSTNAQRVHKLALGGILAIEKGFNGCIELGDDWSTQAAL